MVLVVKKYMSLPCMFVSFEGFMPMRWEHGIIKIGFNFKGNGSVSVNIANATGIR